MALDQRYFYELADITSTGVVVHGTDTSILYANDYAKAFLGIDSSGQQLDSDKLQFLDEMGHPMLEDKLPVALVLKTKKAVRDVKVGIRAASETKTRWALCNAKPLLAENGELAEVLVSFTDITKSMKAEQDLERERRRLLMAQQATKIGTWEFDLSTQEIYWSDTVFEIFGLNPILGPPSFEQYLGLLSEKDRSEITLLTDLAISRGDPYEVFHELKREGGEVRQIRASGQVIRDAQGRPTCLHGAIMDVTEQVRREHDSKTLAMVAQNTENAVIVTDKSGKTEWVNHGFTRMSGYNLFEVIGKKPGEILQGPETSAETKTEISAALREGRSITTEILNYSKEGRPYWLHLNIQPIFDKHKQVSKFVAIQLDLTERQQKEKKIHELNQKLSRALADKDRFFSILAHDLRAPFTALLGLMRLLVADIYNLPPEELKKLAENILDSGENTLDLINNLLEWAQCQTDSFTLESRLVDIKDLVDKAVKRLNRVAENKDIRIEVNILASELQCEVDPNMMMSALQNLVSNAIKFSQAGSVIEVKVDSEHGGDLRIDVRDEGVGMTQEVQDTLFSVGHKSYGVGTHGEKGTGLGLVLCKDFVEKNQGQLSLVSQVGVGSTFTIHLPMADAALKDEAA